ncbi:MFS transporter [Nocardia sp. NPDC019395]|uniref:MFS transporter n=1 Tax=Nocardia sp. NPDC019395 TaxID=3154686 RepID=UPI0033D50DC2
MAGLLSENNNYRLFYLARLSSIAGSQITYVAVPVLTLRMYESAVAAAVVTSSQYVATLLLGPLAGAWSDRHDLRRSLIVADAVRSVLFAVVAALIGLTNHVPVAVFCLIIMANSAFAALFDSSSMPFFAALVRKEDYSRAVSQSDARDYSIAMIGPVIGAALFTINNWLPFALDAVSYLISLVLILRIDTAKTRGVERAPSEGSILTSAKDGARFVLTHRILSPAVVLNAVQSLVLSAVVFLLLAKAAGGDSVLPGLLLSMQALGGLIGSLLIMRLFGILGGFKLLILQNFVWASTLLLGAILMHFFGVVAGLFVLLLVWIPVPSARFAFGNYVNFSVTGSMRGRTAAVSQVVASIFALVGPVLGGLIADGRHYVGGLLGLGAVTLLAGIVNWNRLWRVSDSDAEIPDERVAK